MWGRPKERWCELELSLVLVQYSALWRGVTGAAGELLPWAASSPSQQHLTGSLGLGGFLGALGKEILKQ